MPTQMHERFLEGLEESALPPQREQRSTLPVVLKVGRVRRCIVSKCYSAALPALDQEFDDVDPKKTAMTARDFQLFCYYGGMIHTGKLHD